MADEVSIITTNAVNDGWVDQVPGAVSSGYQAQNTMISASLIGVDSTHVTADGSSVTIHRGGLIDDRGLPFVVTADTTLSGAPGPSFRYFRLTTGSTWDKRTLEITDEVPTYDPVRRGLYRDEKRYLNWFYIRKQFQVFRIVNPNDERLRVADFLNIDGVATDFNLRFEPGGQALASFDLKALRVTGVTSTVFALPFRFVGGRFKVSFGYWHYKASAWFSVNRSRFGSITEIDRWYTLEEEQNAELIVELEPQDELVVLGKKTSGPPRDGVVYISDFSVGVETLPSDFMRTLLWGIPYVGPDDLPLSISKKDSTDEEQPPSEKDSTDEEQPPSEETDNSDNKNQGR